MGHHAGNIPGHGLNDVHGGDEGEGMGESRPAARLAEEAVKLAVEATWPWRSPSAGAGQSPSVAPARPQNARLVRVPMTSTEDGHVRMDLIIRFSI
jgi:hypothetical protein